MEVVNNWRAAHSFPLNTIQMGLRQRARNVHDRVLIAQRLKRVVPIIAKLQRETSMNLSRMQDIGGCRAVVDTVSQVRRIRAASGGSRQVHEFVGEKDYIARPKPSGYRGVHLVYRYVSAKSPDHNGRLIEIQLRSRLQHAWATAVGTVGTFLQQALKATEGSGDWLHFFVLTGSAFALTERTPLIDGTPSHEGQLRAEISAAVESLQVQKTLSAYGTALKIFESPDMKGSYYYLLELMPGRSQLRVTGYDKEDLEQATSQYLRAEKQLASSPGAQAVLVAVDSITNLKRAYPNFLLDTQVFSAFVRKFTQSA